MKRKTFEFLYENRSSKGIDVWLSVTDDCRNVTFPGASPTRRTSHPFLGDLYFFHLDGNAQLSMKAEAGYWDPVGKSAEEKAFFLRSSSLIPVDEETLQEAQQIVRDAVDDHAKVRLLFRHIRDHYKYSTKFNKRGVPYCKASKKGDCGELSALLASYCRSLGIPARVLVGAWMGKNEPHAWNEVFLEGKGWTPMDVSIAMWTFFRHPLRNIGATIKYGVFSNKKKYEKGIEGNRVVFSIDPERELTPSYSSVDPPTDSSTYMIGDTRLAWGFDSIQNKAPYMQPIYPRLNEEYTKISNRDLLGNVTIKPAKAVDRTTLLMKKYSFVIGVLLVYATILMDWFSVAVPASYAASALSTISLGIFALLTIIRKEYNLPILVLCLLFVFSAVGLVY
ncbi:transglutaminase-like domain-containing protein [Halobacillus sp. BAB-2008]|uniref:transglutaminase-like domain-containing protein n=1 Tax=Halobacillus sp. BAB-2008 TaxID=1246484 RepID=UPI0002A50B68|nr:transglutaminase-like domain-containing protein [Halobacillus sp. BAB-2008]ELK45662.1 transglutaminase-like enzyme, putative cysteine protease [Halobacillus sp. BAB-2008]